MHVTGSSLTNMKLGAKSDVPPALVTVIVAPPVVKAAAVALVGCATGYHPTGTVPEIVTTPTNVTLPPPDHPHPVNVVAVRPVQVAVRLVDTPPTRPVAVRTGIR